MQRVGKRTPKNLFFLPLLQGIDKCIFICYNIFVQKYKKIVDIDEAEIKRLLQEIKDEREYNFVCMNSFLYRELSELNKKYTFYDIRSKNQSYKTKLTQHKNCAKI